MWYPCCSPRAEELAAPYYAFKDAGVHVDVVSIKGGRIPVGKMLPLFVILLHCLIRTESNRRRYGISGWS